MNSKVLIDSDVILDLFFNRKPHAQFAETIFKMCEAGKIKGYVTSIIISNTYYLLKKITTHEKVIAKLRLLISITEVINTDKETVLTSLNSDFKDFEDALQHFSAVKFGGIDTIITRNIKDYKKSKLSVMTPESFSLTISDNN